MQMKKYKLGEIAEINASSIKSSDKIDEILYLDTANITENRIDTLQRFGLKKAPSRAQRKVKDNTIIFSTVRPNQSHFGIMKNPASNLIVSSGFAILDIKKPDEFNADYLYYNLTQPFILNYLQTVAQNQVSSYPSINPSDLANLNLSFPPFSEQKKIASVLSTLDEKIALNRRINANLEQMAKRLYDYWFVQFDFPNSDGKPYKSSGGKMFYNAALKREIPDGWEVKSCSDFFELGNGKDYRHLQSGKIPVYGSGGFMCGITDFLFDGESVLFPRKGTLNNIMYKNEKFWTVDTMFYSKMKIQHSAIYVYYTAKKFDFSSLNTGTGVPSMTSVIIKGLPIIQPPQKIIDNFDCIVQSYYKKIHKNEQESAKLTVLRDKLLPLLMNGQVEVKKE